MPGGEGLFRKSVKLPIIGGFLHQNKALNISVAQLGARMHYAVPYIFYSRGCLGRFYTDFYTKKALLNLFNLSRKIIFEPQLEKLRTRRHPGIPDSKVTSFSFLGYMYAREIQACKSIIDRISVYLKYGKNFGNKVVKDWDGRSNAVYLYNTAAWEIGSHCKRVGCKVILEQTIAPFSFERNILSEEHDRYPEWSKSAVNPYGMNDIFREYIEREQAEHCNADLIIGASQFVKSALAVDSPSVRIESVPYGVSIAEGGESRRSGKRGDCLHVLVVGAGLRKGTQYVLEAAQQLKGQAKFRLIGDIYDISDAVKNQINMSLDWIGNVPRSAMPQHYAWADVMLLPSLCEGSATVIYEAIAFSLPVITTVNAGSVIEHEKHGVIIPIRSSTSIIEAVLSMKDSNRIKRYRTNLAQLAIQYTVESYAERLLAAINI